MPSACEGLLKRLWHATPMSRPTFADALPALQAVLENLPMQTLDSSLNRSLGRDALDSLDALSGLSLKPR